MNYFKKYKYQVVKYQVVKNQDSSIKYQVVKHQVIMMLSIKLVMNSQNHSPINRLVGWDGFAFAVSIGNNGLSIGIARSF